jgi:N6-L-threonylcarbamoyladenine synthase
MSKIYILGIETSCDETAIAIVDNEKNILAHKVYSQIKEHSLYKGVVPELAARCHLDKIDGLIKLSLEEAKLELSDLNAIAVTTGPGLVGGLIVGLMYAKTMSHFLKIPLISVNHLEAHLSVAKIEQEVQFPYISLLVSGGHSQVIFSKDLGEHVELGSTLDDAIGEAFDKVAKMLNLDYPGGPEIEKFALQGRDLNIFPVPLKGSNNCNFSLSGLKTAVYNYVQNNSKVGKQEKSDICASFQSSVASMICDRLKKAFKICSQKFDYNSDLKLVVSGGVASNKYLRQQIKNICDKNFYKAIFPSINLCTDNGVMVAWLGVEKYLRNEFAELNIAPKSRWPLEGMN